MFVRRSVVIALLGASLLASRAAHADDAQAARAAYDRGAAAYDTGDFALATSELARADELAANDVVLELALKAAVKADDARMAMQLALRADARQRTGALAAEAAAAREKMASRTGTLLVTCPGRTSCTATVDASPFVAGTRTVVLVGVHRVTVMGAGGPREAFDARIEPGANIEVKASPASAVLLVGPVAPPRESAAESGISPAWFWVGVGVTAVLGGAAIASAADTRTKHDDFRKNPTAGGQEQGLDAQLRTNLLTGGAGVAAVAPAVLGLVFVRWSSPAKATQAGL